MDETLAELCISNTATGSRSSWHYIYAEPRAPRTLGHWRLVGARHRRGGNATVLAVYPTQEAAELVADMLSAGGHWFQTGGSFHKSPGTTH